MTVGVGTLSKSKKANLLKTMSLEAYFQAEDVSLEKNEFHNGKVIKMAGGTYNHDSLSLKAGKLMDNFVEDNDLNYRVNSSEIKIRIEAYNKVVYADALVISEKPAFYNNRKDTITNPILIVEVLSDSTGEHDRTTKFEYYRTIPSFKEYVLIHQDKKHVSVYTQQEDDSWRLKDYETDDATAILYALQNCPIPLKRLYRGLEI
jgi:Uma2 family endonuclease